MMKLEEQSKAAIAAATANLTMLNATVAESTNKLTNSFSHAMTMKDMLRADVSKMSLPLQERIQMMRERHYENAIRIEMEKHTQQDETSTKL